MYKLWFQDMISIQADDSKTYESKNYFLNIP